MAMNNYPAVLVDLNISVWTGRKLDRKVSDEVAVAKNAAGNAGNFTKNLVAGNTLLADANKFAAQFRLWNNTQTIPWNDSGTRMLPMNNFMAYKDGYNVRKATLESMFDTFWIAYPTIVNNAAVQLGAMFDINDYPTLDSVKDKFRVVFACSPLPTSGDFRIDSTEEIKRELEQQYEAQYNSKIADAMRDLWNRLHETLRHISDRMTDKAEVDENGDTKRQKFRDTVLENPTELCDLLTRLNVTADPKLEAARQELENAISGLSPKTLREDPDSRADLKAKVDALLDKYEW